MLDEREVSRVTHRVSTTQRQSDSDLADVLEHTHPRRDDSHWVFSPDERVQVVRRLFLADGSPWIARFSLLLGASVLIATLGLANDQPAAVIAAMVLAPLMTPLLGMACALVLGLVRRALRLLVVLILASSGALVLGWLVAASLVTQTLTAEELARTEPRLRDFAIAIAAGAVAMYSTVRKDLWSVVPGVAIAVALVPPLTTAGVMAEARHWDLARGAILLYGVNVLGIVLAAVGVLLVTDFMRSPSLREPRVLVAAFVTVIVAVAVIAPVWINSRRLDDEVRFEHAAEVAISEWASAHPAFDVTSQLISPGKVTLVISGATEPPDLLALRTAMATKRFTTPSLQVHWVQASVIDVTP